MAERPVQTGVGVGRLFTEGDVKALMLVAHIRGFKSRTHAEDARSPLWRERIIEEFDTKAGEGKDHYQLTFPPDTPIMALSVGALHQLIAFAVARGVFLADSPELDGDKAPEKVLAEWLERQADAGGERDGV